MPSWSHDSASSTGYVICRAQGKMKMHNNLKFIKNFKMAIADHYSKPGALCDHTGRMLMKPFCWQDTHLIKSNMASTVLTSGLLPLLSISPTFWLTPGLMVTTSTIPVAKESIHRAVRPFQSTQHPQCILLWPTGHGGTPGSSQNAESQLRLQQQP